MKEYFFQDLIFIRDHSFSIINVMQNRTVFCLQQYTRFYDKSLCIKNNTRYPYFKVRVLSDDRECEWKKQLKEKRYIPHFLLVYCEDLPKIVYQCYHWSSLLSEAYIRDLLHKTISKGYPLKKNRPDRNEWKKIETLLFRGSWNRTCTFCLVFDQMMVSQTYFLLYFTKFLHSIVISLFYF